MSEQTVVATFERADEVLQAAGMVRRAGFDDVDIVSPFSIDGAGEALGLAPSPVRPIMLAGGVLAGAAIFVMQAVSAVVDYPINAGGRALFSWPAFIVPTLEVAILGGAVAGAIVMLRKTGLPSPHHRQFALPGIERASQDRFFLVVSGSDAGFDAGAVRDLLNDLNPISVMDGEK